jgi:hypothetical protein
MKFTRKHHCADSAHRSVLIEMLESRDFKSVTTSSGDSWTDLSSYQYVAVADVGDPYGTPQLITGTNSSTNAWASAPWGAADDGSVDTGTVSFTLQVTSTSVTWTVAGVTASFSISAGNFSKVAIRAGVDEYGLASEMSGLNVSFFNGSTLGESQSAGALSANTLDADTNDPAEALAVVTANNTSANYNKVVVTGTMRLQADSGMYPSSSDLFGQVFVS